MYGLNQGTRIGQYVLEQQLGAGGQGSVWRARPEAAPEAQPIALKIIPVRGTPPSMVERVRREAEALIRLSKGHSSVVACHGVIEDPTLGVLAVAMELVSGVELEAALRDPRCDATARETLLLHVARALGYLHDAGFVHRDVKPQNILISHDFFANPADPSTVKLVDFGIATPKGNPKPLTEVGTVIGTPAYMAPERIDPMFWPGAPGLPSDDVWALGVVAYEALFGRHPAVNDDDGSLSIYAERYRQIARSGEVWPQLPPTHRWTSALRGALALKQSERFADGNAVAEAVMRGSAPARSGSHTEMGMPMMAGMAAAQVSGAVTNPAGGPGYTNTGPGYTNIGGTGPGYTNVGGTGPGYTNVGGAGPGYTNVGAMTSGHTQFGGVVPDTGGGSWNTPQPYAAAMQPPWVGSGVPNPMPLSPLGRPAYQERKSSSSLLMMVGVLGVGVLVIPMLVYGFRLLRGSAEPDEAPTPIVTASPTETATVGATTPVETAPYPTTTETAPHPTATVTSTAPKPTATSTAPKPTATATSIPTVFPTATTTATPSNTVVIGQPTATATTSPATTFPRIGQIFLPRPTATATSTPAPTATTTSTSAPTTTGGRPSSPIKIIRGGGTSTTPTATATSTATSTSTGGRPTIKILH